MMSLSYSTMQCYYMAHCCSCLYAADEFWCLSSRVLNVVKVPCEDPTVIHGKELHKIYTTITARI
jgi:hypothetical protein